MSYKILIGSQRMTTNHAKVHHINLFLSCVCILKPSLLLGKWECDDLPVVPGHLSIEAAVLFTAFKMSSLLQGNIVLAF